MKRYKSVRFPLEAYHLWKAKQDLIKQRIRIKTKKEVNVPLSDILVFYGKHRQFMWDDDILPFFVKKKKRVSIPDGGIV